MSKVSVIVPVYNVEKYLCQCIDSLLGQTLRDVEIICVDDGSTDNSGAILDEYAANDSRVKVIHQANAGAGPARNAGMDAATGAYLFFCDPDDWCKQGMLKAMYARAVQKDADIIVAGTTFVDGASGEMIKTRGIHPKLWLFRQPFAPSSAADDLFTIVENAAWDKLFRTAFVRQHGLRFQSLPNCNDLFFVKSALVMARRITWAGGAWYCHRVGRVGSLQNTKDRSPHSVFDAHDAVWKQLCDTGMDKQYCIGFLASLQTCGLIYLWTLVRPENRHLCLNALKQRVESLMANLSPDDLNRNPNVIKTARKILAASSPDELKSKARPPSKIKQWRWTHLPFIVNEGIRVFGFVLRTKMKYIKKAFAK